MDVFIFADASEELMAAKLKEFFPGVQSVDIRKAISD
jgi:hypothetical protein